MTPECFSVVILCVVVFVSEYLDSSLGMGYGTALTPVLILMGYDPLTVVPAVLVSQLVTDIAACASHQRCANVDLRISSPDFKVAALLGAVSSIGVLVAVVLAVKLPKPLLTSYIGTLVFAMGVLILVTLRRPMAMSWRKIAAISLVAAFNKGISGGGYGPLVMGGQILSGVQARNAVGITAFAEAITCLVGFLAFVALGKALDWNLIILLCASALPAVPFAALTVKKIPVDKLKVWVGVLIMGLGLLTLLRVASG